MAEVIKSIEDEHRDRSNPCGIAYIPRTWVNIQVGALFRKWTSQLHSSLCRFACNETGAYGSVAG